MADQTPASQSSPQPVDEKRVEQALQVNEMRLQNMLHFFAEATQQLSSSLDYETTLQRLTQLIVPRLADWCVADMLGEGGQIELSVVAHADAEKVIWGNELRRRYPVRRTDSRGIYHVIETQEAELYPEVTDDMLSAGAVDDEHLRLLRNVGHSSSLTVPLVARGRAIGALTLVAAESRQHYGADDLTVAQELANRAALAVDNARLYRDAQQARQSAEAAVEQTIRLQNVTAALAQLLDPVQVAQATVDECLAAMGASAGLIALASAERQILEIVYIKGHDETRVRKWRQMPLQQELPMTDVARTGELLLIESQAEWFARYPDVTDYVTSQSMAIIPLKVDERVIGVMQLGFAQKQAFSAADKSFISTTGLKKEGWRRNNSG